jgi:hypothetical protein
MIIFIILRPENRLYANFLGKKGRFIYNIDFDS